MTRAIWRRALVHPAKSPPHEGGGELVGTSAITAPCPAHSLGIMPDVAPLSRHRGITPASASLDVPVGSGTSSWWGMLAAESDPERLAARGWSLRVDPAALEADA